MIHNVVTETGQVAIPAWVVDFDSFRRWLDLGAMPEKLNAYFLDGSVWVDLSREPIFTHNLVNTTIIVGLGSLRIAEEKGTLWGTGLRYSHAEAGFSLLPDGLYASFQSLANGSVTLAKSGTELGGSPDMVLEVVSESSVEKDTERLREAYWKANVREYWLVDARVEPIQFDILRHTGRGYSATRKQDGWLRSPVFGKAFRLTVVKTTQGHPDYRQEVR